MRDNYYRTGEGFLCVYSITIEDSYRLLTNFHEQILRVTENDGVRRTLVLGERDDLPAQTNV
jgi:Ras-related protein Ral-A